MVVMEKEAEHPAPPFEPQKVTEPEPQEKATISVSDVDFCYGSNQVLHDINLEIPPRAVTAFTGPSGCGKTTLLRCFNRMNDLIDGAHISAGKIELEGHDINAPDVDVVELRRRVGMVFQRPNPFPKSIFDNVAYGLRERGSRRPSRRSLAVRPEVLLLDEPCSALDPLSTQAIEDLIVQLRSEVAIVIVTHNLQQAYRVADRVAFMYLGDLVEYGEADQVFGAPEAQRTRQYVSGAFG